MAYSEKLLDYFQNPRCVGEIPDAHAIAQVSNPVCGDVMKLWVKVEGGHIQDAKFKAQGCSAVIAPSSYATEMLLAGRSLGCPACGHPTGNSLLRFEPGK